jgi:hypothetical protein
MASTPVSAAGEVNQNKGSALSKLSAGERQKLMLLVLNFLVLGMGSAIYMFYQSLGAMEEEIERYRQAIEAMAEVAPKLAEAKAAAAQGAEDSASRFTPEILSKNDLKLTSFVASHATAADIKIENYDEDSIILSNNKDTGASLVEKIVKVEVREVEFDKLLNFLERIETSREPVVIKVISLRAKDTKKRDGLVRASLQISTYVQK